MADNLVQLLECEKKLKVQSQKVDVDVLLPDGGVFIQTPIWGAITPESIVKFNLDYNTRAISILSNCIGGSREYILGIVEDYEKALKWLNKVNKCYTHPPDLHEGRRAVWDWSEAD